MYDDYNKLTTQEQKKLLREIDKSYEEATKEITAQINGIVEDRGKSQRDKIIAITGILTALWVTNGAGILLTSEKIMETTWVYYEYASIKLGNPLILPMKEISEQIGKTVKKRQNMIKWKTVIRGNSKRLDRTVSRIIKKGLANSKTERQIQAELEKVMGMNRGKAKAIARTETNYYKSETKMQVGKRQEQAGNVIVKTWVYTFRSKEPRPNHQMANGEKVFGIDAYFDIGGFKTKAPHHFGIASQDINCMCDMRVEFDRAVNTSVSEFQTYAGGKR